MPAVSMTVGQLPDRGTWFRPDRSRKQGGQSVTTYELVGTMWANVRPAGGDERDAHGQPLMIRSHVVTVRDKPHDVQPDWLGVWNGLTLNVVAAGRADGNDGGWIVADCLETVPATT